MIGEAACSRARGCVDRSSTARMARTFSRAENGRRLPKDVDALRGGDCKKGRDHGGENE